MRSSKFILYFLVTFRILIWIAEKFKVKQRPKFESSLDDYHPSNRSESKNIEIQNHLNALRKKITSAKMRNDKLRRNVKLRLTSRTGN